MDVDSSDNATPHCAPSHSSSIYFTSTSASVDKVIKPQFGAHALRGMIELQTPIVSSTCTQESLPNMSRNTVTETPNQGTSQDFSLLPLHSMSSSSKSDHTNQTCFKCNDFHTMKKAGLSDHSYFYKQLNTDLDVAYLSNVAKYMSDRLKTSVLGKYLHCCSCPKIRERLVVHRQQHERRKHYYSNHKMWVPSSDKEIRSQYYDTLQDDHQGMGASSGSSTQIADSTRKVTRGSSPLGAASKKTVSILQGNKFNKNKFNNNWPEHDSGHCNPGSKSCAAIDNDSRKSRNLHKRKDSREHFKKRSIVFCKKIHDIPDCSECNINKKDYASYFKKIRYEVLNWLDEIPVYFNMKQLEKRNSYYEAHILIENICKLSKYIRSKHYQKYLKSTIEICLDSLPMWSPQNKKDKCYFRKIITKNIFDRILEVNNNYFYKTIYLQNNLQDYTISKMSTEDTNNKNTNVWPIIPYHYYASSEIAQWLDRIQLSGDCEFNKEYMKNTILKNIEPFINTDNIESLVHRIFATLSCAPINISRFENENIELMAQDLTDRLLFIHSKYYKAIAQKVLAVNNQTQSTHSKSIDKKKQLSNDTLSESVERIVSFGFETFQISCDEYEIKSKVINILKQYIHSQIKNRDNQIKVDIMNLFKKYGKYEYLKITEFIRYLTNAVRQLTSCETYSNYILSENIVSQTVSKNIFVFQTNSEKVGTSTPRQSDILQNFDPDISKIKCESNIDNLKQQNTRYTPEELDYFAKIRFEIENWLALVPIDIDSLEDLNFKNIMINDLAGDIVDRQKYIQLNPDETTENEEKEYIKYLIFRWLRRMMEIEEFSAEVLEFHVPNLVTNVEAIQVPNLTKPHHGNRQELKILSHHPPLGLDILEDEISIWLNEQPSNIISSDNLERNALVQELAAKIKECLLEVENPDTVIENEIGKWLSKIFKTQTHLNSMKVTLKERIQNIPVKVFETPRLTPEDLFAEQVVATHINWLKEQPFYKQNAIKDNNAQIRHVTRLAKEILDLESSLSSKYLKAEDKFVQLMTTLKDRLRALPIGPGLMLKDRYSFKFIDSAAKQLLQRVANLESAQQKQTVLTPEISEHVKVWFQRLPIKTKTAKQTEELESLIVSLSKLRSLRDGRSPEAYKNLLKKEIILFLKKCPLDTDFKNNEQLLNNNADMLIKLMIVSPLTDRVGQTKNSFSTEEKMNDFDSLDIDIPTGKDYSIEMDIQDDVPTEALKIIKSENNIDTDKEDKEMNIFRKSSHHSMSFSTDEGSNLNLLQEKSIKCIPGTTNSQEKENTTPKNFQVISAPPSDESFIDGSLTKCSKRISCQPEVDKQTNTDVVNESSTLCNDEILKHVITKFIEQYETGDTLIKEAFTERLISELKKLSRSFSEGAAIAPLQKKDVMDVISKERFHVETLIIKEVSNWLERSPIEPNYNCIENKERAAQVSEISEKLYDAALVHNNSDEVKRIIYLYIQELPLSTDDKSQTSLIANDLLDRLNYIIQDKATNSPDKKDISHYTKEEDGRSDEQKLKDFIEDFIQYVHNSLSSDELTRDAMASKLLKVFKIYIKNLKKVPTKLEIYENLMQVSMPGEETVKEFAMELKFIKCINKWLKQMPLTKLTNDKQRKQRVKEINKLARYLCEIQNRLQDNQLYKHDDEFVDYVSNWLNFNLVPGQEDNYTLFIRKLLVLVEEALLQENVDEHEVNKIITDNDNSLHTHSADLRKHYSGENIEENKSESFKENIPIRSSLLHPETNSSSKQENIQSTKRTIMKRATDLLYEAVENWCDLLPLQGDNEAIKIVKENFLNEILKIIGTLNLDMIVYNDSILYQHMLLDRVQELINRNNFLVIPDSLVHQLTKDVLEANRIMKLLAAGDNYKIQLETTVENFLTQHFLHKKKYEIESLKILLAELFIIDNYDSENVINKKPYETKVFTELQKFIVFFGVENASDLYFKLRNEMLKVPAPSIDALCAQVDIIKTKESVLKWITNLPIKPPLSEAEVTERNKISEILAKRIHEITKKESEIDFKIKLEIKKWLHKLPFYNYDSHFEESLVKDLKENIITNLDNNKQASISVFKTNDTKTIDHLLTTKSVNSELYLQPRNIGDLLYDVVWTWCNALFANSNTIDDYKNEDLRTEIVTKILLIISELNMDEFMFNDTFLYNAKLSDELDNIIRNLSLSPAAKENSLSSKKTLIDSVNKIKPLLKTTKDRYNYKQRLENTVDNVLSQFQSKMLPCEKTIYENFKTRIVDDFILLQSLKHDEPGKLMCRQRILETAYNFFSNNYNKDDDPHIPKNLLLFELGKVSVPNEISIREEVDEICIKKIVSDWLQETLQEHPSYNDEINKNKITVVLAKRLNDLEKCKQSNESEQKMFKEISHWLNKMNRITHGNNQILVDKLLNKIKNTREERQYLNANQFTSGKYKNEPELDSQWMSLADGTNRSSIWKSFPNFTEIKSAHPFQHQSLHHSDASGGNQSFHEIQEPLGNTDFFGRVPFSSSLLEKQNQITPQYNESNSCKTVEPMSSVRNQYVHYENPEQMKQSIEVTASDKQKNNIFGNEPFSTQFKEQRRLNYDWNTYNNYKDGINTPRNQKRFVESFPSPAARVQKKLFTSQPEEVNNQPLASTSRQLASESSSFELFKKQSDTPECYVDEFRFKKENRGNICRKCSTAFMGFWYHCHKFDFPYFYVPLHVHYRYFGFY